MYFQEINEVDFFLSLFETISALGLYIEYVACFQDRKYFPNLFWKNGCLKMPDSNKDGENDVGPSVYMLFVIISHLQKELSSHACPKKNQAKNKQ